jgi:L-2,4-diaminobutyrate decarboxylase
MEVLVTTREDGDIAAARERIQKAYDTEAFRSLGHELIDLLSSHLGKVGRRDSPVLPWREPEVNVREAERFLGAFQAADVTPEDLGDHFGELARIMLARGINLHDPRYIGHQVPASSPFAGLFDALGSVTNQVMAIYEMGPWATAVEEAMVNRLGKELGWEPGTFSGLTTHGGSLANLTALLTARNVSLKDSWESGMSARDRDNPPVVVVHGDAHYSISRAVGVLGFGTRGVIKTRLDDRRRMDPEDLNVTLGKLRARNQPVAAVVACACATPIGAFDPLREIADVCRHHDVWLHVDAAHGGSAIFSESHGHLVSGLEQADSITWDAHKMMFAPALCAFVLYRNRAHRFEAFRQEAPYIFDPTVPGLMDYDVGLRTVECTKRATAFGVWGLWALFGRQLFADLIDVTFNLGKVLYGKLASVHDFEAIHEPQCNIVAFRHCPKFIAGKPAEAVSRFQFKLRRSLIESGEFYIVSTEIGGVGALRVAIMNPLTTAADLDRLLDALREHGEKIAIESET